MSDRLGSGGASASQIAAALLLPPLGLHLAAARPRHFWIGAGLTVLGFVPGVVFALWRVFQARTSRDAA